MVHKLRVLTFSFLLMVAAPFSQALAAPYTYQFTSGGLTGTWTTEPPNPVFGQWSILSFNITTPLGVVWHSDNPAVNIFENRNFGGFTQFEACFPTDCIEGPIQGNLSFTTNGPTNADPNMRFGTYEFATLGPGFGPPIASGIGEWKLVPVPDMLWPTVVGLLGLAFFMERRRRQAHLVR